MIQVGNSSWIVSLVGYERLGMGERKELLHVDAFRQRESPSEATLRPTLPPLEDIHMRSTSLRSDVGLRSSS